MGDVVDRLDVLNDGRLAPKPGHLGVRRFGSRNRPPAFERIQQGGFFSADVPAGAGMQMDVEREV